MAKNMATVAAIQSEQARDICFLCAEVDVLRDALAVAISGCERTRERVLASLTHHPTDPRIIAEAVADLDKAALYSKAANSLRESIQRSCRFDV